MDPVEATFEDDDRLAEAIDELVRGDPRDRMLSKAVLKRQAELRAGLDQAQWQAYLRVEEAANVRTAALLYLVARWAFRLGRRRGRQ